MSLPVEEKQDISKPLFWSGFKRSDVSTWMALKFWIITRRGLEQKVAHQKVIEYHFNGQNVTRLSYCLPAMLLDRACQSGWGPQKQHTGGLRRHEHAAFHLPLSLACLSNPLSELSAVMCICRVRWRLADWCLEEATHIAQALWNWARVGLICKAIWQQKQNTLQLQTKFGRCKLLRLLKQETEKRYFR